jgi:hypothetical protein
MSLRPARARRSRTITQTGLALMLATGGVLAASSSASAADNDVVGPIRRNCTVAGHEVSFDVWIRWSPQSTRYAIDKFNWDTHSFTPSRLTVSVRNKSGSSEDMVRVWGGDADTLHDVPARFSTIQPWEAAGKHAAVDNNYIRSTVYLNDETGMRCNVTINVSDYW